ncbi:hypothetical protein [Phreatobacter sp.]|uniref:hypothetical protein n=1 Tax=Phreatobacter sp. TaxID=1966341 RepID=UPI003F71BBD6
MVAIGKVTRTAPLRWTRRQTLAERRRPADTGTGFAEAIQTLPAVTQADPEPLWPLHRRPAATFVAQLLATRFNLQQARRRMTASMEEAEASYQSADSGRRPGGPGRIVRRDI